VAADRDVLAHDHLPADLGDPSVRDADALASALGVDPAAGLSTGDAADRLAAEGPNELAGTPPVPAWRRFLRQFADPLIYLLFAAIAISLAAWILEGGRGLPVDAIVVAVIVVLNAVIGYVQEARADDAVAALRRLSRPHSTVLRDGRLVSVATRELVRGDILVLAEGDQVGADARLLSAEGLLVQESSLTGESEARLKTADTLPERVALADRTDMVHKGTAVVQGVGRAVVTATGMDTEMGSIATMLAETTAEQTPMARDIAAISRNLGLLVVVIAIVVMAVTVAVNRVYTADGLVDVLLMGVSLAVAAVPEGLPAILSVVLALGVQRLARLRAIVKSLPAVETLGSASVICSDKTGTLTRNEMFIQRAVTASGEVALTGSGYRPDGDVRIERLTPTAFSGEDGTSPGGPQDGDDPDLLAEVRALLTGGYLANNAQLDRSADDSWSVQGDPTEAAFVVAAHKLSGVTDRAASYQRVREVPFTSERKMMSTLQRPPEPVEGRPASSHRLMTKGAPDVLLTHCDTLLVGSGTRPLTDRDRRRVSDLVDRMSDHAYRTLAVAYRDVDDPDDLAEEGLTLVGVVGIIDPARPEARTAVAEAHRAGIRVVMITGDHARTAARIGADLGIVPDGARVLTGPDLDRLSPAEFRAAIREVSLYARVAPAHKLRIVDALQDEGQVVAMTGDGVNDAPSLKRADIGIAMGVTGTEVSKEAARMILADDNFATIVTAVRQGRVIFANIRKFLRYLLSSNIGEVVTVFLGVLLAGFIGLHGTAGSGLAVPLLATQILWINLITDSGPALAMGVDPEIDDVMAAGPRRRDDRLLDAGTWAGIGFIGVVMGLVTLLTIDLFLPGGLLDGHADYARAQTAGFTTLVLAQLFNALNARSPSSSVFRFTGVPGAGGHNPWLWGALGLAVVLQLLVVHVPVLQTAFGTTGLRPIDWLICLAMASVVLWTDEVRKLAGRFAAARRRP